MMEPRNRFFDEMVEHIATSSRRHPSLVRDDIVDTLKGVSFENLAYSYSVPRLMIHRLRMTGTILPDGENRDFVYDQEFCSGVNVLLVPQNNVGKSSIMKTIRFGLTGDQKPYDRDVKQWIHNVWLSFSLDHVYYTSIIKVSPKDVRAAIVAGSCFEPIDIAIQQAHSIFDAVGETKIKEEFQQFFFRELGLNALAWTKDETGTVCYTTWLTYFQALVIPDDGDTYLLCDKPNSIGNQQGLLISAFLGLPLSKIINNLLVAKRQIDVEIKKEERRIEQLQARIGYNTPQQLRESLEQKQKRLEELDHEIKQRQDVSQQQIDVQAHQRLLQEQYDKEQLVFDMKTQLERLQRTIRSEQSNITQLRQAIDLSLHFTGIPVRICPNCESEVDEEAVRIEIQQHVCRLCHKPAQPSSPEDMTRTKQSLVEREEQLKTQQEQAKVLRQQIRETEQKVAALQQQNTALARIAEPPFNASETTWAEDQERRNLLKDIGRIENQLEFYDTLAATQSSEIEQGKLRQYILNKARERVDIEAQNENTEIVGQFRTLFQNVIKQIGTSITDTTISPKGTINFIKNQQKVTFTTVNNEGERLRIKMAFFLALMQLGCHVNAGRHPGFLLLDQPGGAEMSTENVIALTDILRDVDSSYENTQIICFSARSEFEQATSERKIYHAQASPYVF